MVLSIQHPIITFKHAIQLAMIILFISACSERREDMFMINHYNGTLSLQESIFETPAALIR